MIVVALLLGGALLGRPGPLHAQPAPDIKTVIETYKQALSRLDGATVASLFADDVVINDLGMTAKGKAEAIAELGQAVAANPGLTVTFGDTIYVLDTTIERFTFRSDPVTAAGFSRLLVIETIVVVNGKIESYTAVFDSSDAETARFLAATAGR